MVNKETINDRIFSNYPILFALILLTAITISTGFGANANQLATYAYFLLMIGVTIRIIELTFSEVLIRKIKSKFIKIKEHKYFPKEKDIIVFFSNVTKNVALFLFTFFIVLLIYGLFVDWFFVKELIKKLGYIITVFGVLHLLIKYGVKS